MPNFGYHFARAKGSIVRKIYRASLGTIVRFSIQPSRVLPFEVYAYSGEAALPEQVASIRSFLRHAGRPARFTVVSDGTYSTQSRALLQAIDPSVAVAQAADWIPADIPEPARPYLTRHPTGRQLALIMSLPVEEPALYVDSDVLFFPGSSSLSSLLHEDVPAHYLADCQLSADDRLFRRADERANPVNTGVLFLSRRLDWSPALARLLELDGAPNFFTNQTLTHLAMHSSGARPLDPQGFVLQLDDQFCYRDRYAASSIVLRHYVNPVRHKFWNAVWR